MRILGVDPGSRLTGYGCIDLAGNHLMHVAHGTLRLSSTGGRSVIPLEKRLLSLYEGLTEIVQKFKPQVLAVEKVFFAKNAVSALKLGQARGAVILTGMIHALEIAEYSATEVKRAVVGQGHADKDQVARMVQLIVGKHEFATADASDGLAIAICHAYMTRSVAVANSSQARMIEALQGPTRGRRKKSRSLAESLGISVAGLGPNVKSIKRF